MTGGATFAVRYNRVDVLSYNLLPLVWVGVIFAQVKGGTLHATA